MKYESINNSVKQALLLISIFVDNVVLRLEENAKLKMCALLRTIKTTIRIKRRTNTYLCLLCLWYHSAWVYGTSKYIYIHIWALSVNRQTDVQINRLAERKKKLATCTQRIICMHIWWRVTYKSPHGIENYVLFVFIAVWMKHLKFCPKSSTTFDFEQKHNNIIYFML